MNNILGKISHYTYSGCWNDNIEFKEEGGSHCIGESNFFFKLISNVSIILINIFLMYYFSKKNNFENLNEKKKLQKKLAKKHKIIKKILGYISVIVLIIQTLLKLDSKTLVFMFNPCHLSCTLSVILFLSEQKKPKIFSYLASTLFGCILAILFPSFGISDSPFKRKLFYFEHLVPYVAIIYLNYIEYNVYDFLSFKKHFEGFFYFSVYQRMVLWTLSELTWANLNFTLCGNSADPFYASFGKYYLIFAEFYLSFASYLIKTTILHISFILLKIKNICIKKKKIN